MTLSLTHDHAYYQSIINTRGQIRGGSDTDGRHPTRVIFCWAAASLYLPPDKEGQFSLCSETKLQTVKTSHLQSSCYTAHSNKTNLLGIIIIAYYSTKNFVAPCVMTKKELSIYLSIYN